jgi:formylglycine-generating enzyme
MRDATKSEWFAACSRAGQRAVLTATPTSPGAATRSQTPPGGVEEVGTFPRCEGGYDGVFDMSGNVMEWENACRSNDPAADCAIRLGAFFQGANDAACGAYTSLEKKRLQPQAWTGIRCCADGDRRLQRASSP